MKRRIAILSVVILATLAAPSLFACQDCPDGFNCIQINGGARFCEFFVDGHCEGIGTCPTSSASLQAEYRVAAVRVIESGKPLPPAQQQSKTAPVLAASK